jgi:hypothetical protein
MLRGKQSEHLEASGPPSPFETAAARGPRQQCGLSMHSPSRPEEVSQALKEQSSYRVSTPLGRSNSNCSRCRKAEKVAHGNFTRRGREGFSGLGWFERLVIGLRTLENNPVQVASFSGDEPWEWVGSPVSSSAGSQDG